MSKAVEAKHDNIIDYLLDQGANPNSAVISAIITFNVQALEKLFNYGAKAQDSSYSEDPVALAAEGAVNLYDPNYAKNPFTPDEQTKYVAILKILLEHGGNPNCDIPEQGEAIPMALSRFKEHPENSIYKDICKLLLKHNKADTSKFKMFKNIIEALTAEIRQEQELEARAKQETDGVDIPHNDFLIEIEEESALLGKILNISTFDVLNSGGE